MSLASFGAGDLFFLSGLKRFFRTNWLRKHFCPVDWLLTGHFHASGLMCHGCRRRSGLLSSGASQFAPEPRRRPAAKHGTSSYNDLLQKNADFS